MLNMNVIWPESGRYIVAVSGGADSMVLLDVLAGAARERGYELVVAHFDHGLRPYSALDAEFVAAAAARSGLPFETATGQLGQASEAAARAARHAWLEEVRGRHDAAAVLTAHHQDDVLETSLLNLARGSGRRGLAPMPIGGPIGRPFIQLTRADLRAHATARAIVWREDPTNADLTNARNLLRHRLLPSGSPEWRRRYLELIAQLTETNRQIDQSISIMENSARRDAQTFSFDRSEFRKYSNAETAEIILAAGQALRPGLQLSRPHLLQAVSVALTGATGTHRPLRHGLVLVVSRDTIELTTKSAH